MISCKQRLACVSSVHARNDYALIGHQQNPNTQDTLAVYWLWLNETAVVLRSSALRQATRTTLEFVHTRNPSRTQK